MEQEQEEEKEEQKEEKEQEEEEQQVHPLTSTVEAALLPPRLLFFSVSKLTAKPQTVCELRQWLFVVLTLHTLKHTLYQDTVCNLQ